MKGGFVDAIMIQNNPLIAQEDDMNRALDACYKAGIGLISMKQVAGNMKLDEIARQLPELKEQGLTPVPGACCTRSGPTSGSRRAASRCGIPTRSARTPRRRGPSSR